MGATKSSANSVIPAEHFTEEFASTPHADRAEVKRGFFDIQDRNGAVGVVESSARQNTLAIME
jgi:hypothetical protein